MTTSYGMVRENSRRAPSPCSLAPPLREAWNAPTSLGGRQYFAPLLAHDGFLLLSAKDRHAVALNATNRKRLWTYPWAGQARVLHQGRVFLWPDEHEVHAVDLSSGRPESVMLCYSCEDALAVDSHLVGWGPDYEYGGQRLWAIDWTSGQRLWTVRLPEDVNVVGCPSATEDALVYCVEDRRNKTAGADANLIACQLSTGLELWRRPQAQLNGVSAVWNDRVLACLGSRVTALSLGDGTLLWEIEGRAGYLYGDRYYFLDSWSGKCIVLDALSGRQLMTWDLRARLPKTLRGTGPSSVCLVTETHIFVQSERNVLLAFTREGGEYVWHHHPKAAQMAGEVVSVGGRLYYQNGRDRIFCLEQKSG